MYNKNGAEADVSKDQMNIMLDAGWSRTKPALTKKLDVEVNDSDSKTISAKPKKTVKKISKK